MGANPIPIDGGGAGKGKAVVVGSGFGGLAAAIRLRAKGYDTTILEMRDKPGGRAYVYEDRGFTFDAGPTIITVPFVLEELATLAGRTLSEFVTIVPCDPYYRIYFDDGRTFNYVGDNDRLEAEIARFSPEDVAGYRRFLDYSRRVFDKAFTGLADHSFDTIWEMVKVAPDLIRLRAEQSVYRRVSSFVKDPALRQVFSFEPLLIGGNPLRSSAIYAMIHYLEKTWGVHFAMGGTGALVRGLVRLFESMGGRLELNRRVEEIEVEAGAVKAVRVVGGERFEADVVVSNADVANTYRKLIRPEHRRKWTDRRIERMRYAMSLFVVYFGTDRTYPHLPHHAIVLGPRYQGLLGDIFDRKVVAKDFSLYLHTPTRTDPSLAPPGCESFYVLSPVPHLGGGQDWDDLAEPYADAILASLEKDHLVPDLRKHLVTRRIFTPKDFETDLDAYLGSAFQFEPILTQSALVPAAQQERGRRRPVLRRRGNASGGGAAGGDLQRQGPGQVPVSAAGGERICRRITRQYARTFYFASSCLPRATRRHAYAVYGFCRWADNGVDDAADRAEATGQLDAAPPGPGTGLRRPRRPAGARRVSPDRPHPGHPEAPVRRSARRHGDGPRRHAVRRLPRAARLLLSGCRRRGPDDVARLRLSRPAMPAQGRGARHGDATHQHPPRRRRGLDTRPALSAARPVGPVRRDRDADRFRPLRRRLARPDRLGDRAGAGVLR